MGFNKGVINKEKIRQTYLHGGYKSVKRMLNSYDAFFIKDNFSSKVIESYYKDELKKFFNEHETNDK